MQTRIDSAKEVFFGTVVGMIGSWLITMGCLYTIDDKVAAGSVTVALCTVWSLVRGYAVRRWFNGPSRLQSARVMLADLEAAANTGVDMICGGAVQRASWPYVSEKLVWPELPDR